MKLSSSPKVIGTFQTANDQEGLEALLGGPERFDRLERAFDTFLIREHKLQEFLACPSDDLGYQLLRLIRLYVRHYRIERNTLMQGTSLQGSDCLTKSVLGAAIAFRKGLPTTVVRPRSSFYSFHAAVAYQWDGEDMVTSLSGKSRHRIYLTLPNEALITRLRFCKPLVNFVNHTRGVY